MSTVSADVFSHRHIALTALVTGLIAAVLNVGCSVARHVCL
jgi:hypothetical protein